MTACVKNHSKRVALAISASLVGALSLGAAAPAVAFASADGIETYATDTATVNKATVTYLNGESGKTFVYNGKKQGLVPSTLSPKGGSDAKRLQLHPAKLVDGHIKESGYYYFYVNMDDTGNDQMNGQLGNVVYENASGIETDLMGSVSFEMPIEVGNYAVVSGYWDVNAKTWTCVNLAATFQIAPQSLDGATIYEGNDMSDTDFSWDGIGGSNTAKNVLENMNVALDGVRLVKGTDVKVTLVDPSTGNLLGDSSAVEVGKTYRAHIEGVSEAFSGMTADVDFTFGKCKLDEATIVGKVEELNIPASFTALSDLADTFNGQPASAVYNEASGYKLEFVSGPEGGAINDHTRVGEYTFKIKAVDGSKLFEGEQTFTYIVCNKKAVIQYKGNGLGPTYDIDLSDDAAARFDASKITAYYQDVSSNRYDVPADQVKVSVTKADGTAADASDLTGTPGTYKVNVKVHYQDKWGNWVAAQASTTVCNYYNVSEASDVFFTFDGENVDSSVADLKHVTYTGKDFAPKMSVEVYAGDTELTEGTDYTTSWQKQQANGTWVDVDSVIDAGNYRYIVSPVDDSIHFGSADDGICYLIIDQMELTPVLQGTVTDRTTGRGQTDDGTFLPYTGSAIVPTFAFVNSEDEAQVVDLPSNAYEFLVTYADGTKEVEVKAYDKWYTAHFTDTAEAGNYTVEGVDVSFKVKVADSFADVKDSDWFVGSVYQAKENGYVKGVSGTESYQPQSKILRRDVVVILARMAGMDDALNGMDEDEFSSEYGTYAEAYSDVSGDAYYAKALAWATKAGVVHGDAGATTFRPDDTITRQEFAAMLSNYAAQVRREDISVDADAVLAGANGEGTVDAWARDAVAWAYSEGIMGNNGASLNGTGDITRAETAAMAVNYQSAPLK